jgi:hypothetical protein
LENKSTELAGEERGCLSLISPAPVLSMGKNAGRAKRNRFQSYGNCLLRYGIRIDRPDPNTTIYKFLAG